MSMCPLRTLRIAYVHYGQQSGVTSAVTRALEERGHVVTLVDATGGLEPKGPSGRRRITRQVLAHLASSIVHYGREALSRRWNTPYAFDAHSRSAGALLEKMEPRPDVVLQNGTMFSPGMPPRVPYVLLLDYTSRLAAQGGAARMARSFPAGWFERERRAYEGAAAVCTFSSRTASSVRDDYAVEPERVHVVGAGANVERSVARCDDGHTILFAGIAFERKGGPVLLQAFHKVRERDPRSRLLIAGPAKPIRSPAGVEHLGRVPRDRMQEIFAMATVFTMPSVREPFGLAYLDAMAGGVPCVGTMVDAVPEILGDGECGLLVPPGDPDALAAALLAVLHEPVLARRLAEAGRRRVESQYRWTHVARELEGVLLAAAHGEMNAVRRRPKIGRGWEGGPHAPASWPYARPPGPHLP